MKHNARTNALVGAGVAACAVAGTLLNEPQSRWYRSLRKPDWQPAPAVFPIAWTALYAAVGLSSASVINRLNKAGWDQDAAAFARALGVNLALNTGWNALFFRVRNLPVATVGAAALAVSSADLARRAATDGGWQVWGLRAYAGWCVFATALTGRIAQLNPRT